MAFKGIDFTCSTSAQLCWTFTGTADAMQNIVVQNLENHVITLGGPDVADESKGIAIKQNESVVLSGYSGEELYAIADTGTPVIKILANRV